MNFVRFLLAILIAVLLYYIGKYLAQAGHNLFGIITCFFISSLIVSAIVFEPVFYINRLIFQE